MGRRSINTTKSGKYMNPTDQARKEARKKELKKNKKQRMMVRQAVLKGKDPLKLLEEMEVIDNMEFDPTQPPKLNEKVLKDKRRKLQETFQRVIRLYERENLDMAIELKKAENDYEKKRSRLQTFFEQVKNAEQVQLDQIPLPDIPMMTTIPSMIPLPGDIPHPTMDDQLHGILKTSSSYIPRLTDMDYMATIDGHRKEMSLPPGPPPGTPPQLSDSEDEEYDPEKGIVENIGTVDIDVEHPHDDMVDEPPPLMADFMVHPDQPPPPGTTNTRKIRFVDDDNRGSEEEEKDTRPRIKKKKKKKKGVTPLQAMMLRMAGQSGPGTVDDDESETSSDSDSEEEREPSRRDTRGEPPRRDTRGGSPRRDTRGEPPRRDTKGGSPRRDTRGEPPRRDTKRSHSDSDTSSDSSDDQIERLAALSKKNQSEASKLQTDEPAAASQAPKLVPPGPPPGAPSGVPAGLPPGPPPGAPRMMFRPPLIRATPPGAPPRLMPPGPPPGRPMGLPPGTAMPGRPLGAPPGGQQLGRPQGLPPGPPPGLPPSIRGMPHRIPGLPGMAPIRIIRPGGLRPPGTMNVNPNVLSAPPSITKLPLKTADEDDQTTATISAKPQLKNILGDVTRFTPTAVKVKREMKDSKGRIKQFGGAKEEDKRPVTTKPAPMVMQQTRTKDDDYEQFMREMVDFL